MFYTNNSVFCPKCEPVYVKSKFGVHRIGLHLDCIIENYSGCSVDIGECPRCGRRFQVSYRVDKIVEIEQNG